METRNRLIEPEVTGKGNKGGKKQKSISKNTYECPMDMGNRVGIDCVSGGWVG